MADINSLENDKQVTQDLLDVTNQLVASLRQRRDLATSTGEAEKLSFSIARQLQFISLNLVASAEKRNNLLSKSKDIEKEIESVEKNRKKTIELQNKGQQALVEAQQNYASQAEKANAKLLDHLRFRYIEESKLEALEIRMSELSTQSLTANEYQRNINERIIEGLAGEVSLTKEILKDRDKIINKLSREKEDNLELEEVTKRTIKYQQKVIDLSEEEIVKLKEAYKERVKVEKSVGLLGAMAKLLSRIPGIGQFLNADEAIKDMEGVSAEILVAGGNVKSFGNQAKIAFAGFKTLASGFIEKALSFESIMLQVVLAGLRANKQSVELGKSMGYGTSKANDFRERMAEIADHSNNINITSKAAVEAFSELASATGLITEYSADALETQVMLTKQLGLSGDEAANIYQLSILTGKSSKQINNNMVGAYASARNQYKVGVPLKTVMAEASKISGQLAANLKNNPELITKAIIQAKALGTTLEQTRKQGESLLEFESSIENELKAELLLGKSLNLERARAAALMGDQITLTEELNKNIGTLDEYQKMNVLQQKAIAASVGLTSDELGEQLKKQKIAIESGKSLAQVTKEQALESEKRQTIEDKFAASILKLQDIIGNLVAGPVGSLLDALVNIVSAAVKFGKPLAIAYGVLKGIQIITARTNALLIARQAILSGELAKSVGIAVAWTIANPLQAIAGLAVAAGVAATIYSSMKGDDVVSEGGYGKRTLLAPEGAISLNDKDTLIAGTNLNSGNKINGPSIDITPMVNAINEVRDAVTKLANKPTTVNMDSRKVSTAVTMAGSYKSA